MDYLAIARTIQADKDRQIETAAHRRRLLAPVEHEEHVGPIRRPPAGRTLAACPCVTAVQRSMVPPAASR